MMACVCGTYNTGKERSTDRRHLVGVDDAIRAEHGSRVGGDAPRRRNIVALVQAHLRPSMGDIKAGASCAWLSNTAVRMDQTSYSCRCKPALPARQAAASLTKRCMLEREDGPVHMVLVEQLGRNDAHFAGEPHLHRRQPPLVLEPAKVQVHELRRHYRLRHARQPLLPHHSSECSASMGTNDAEAACHLTHTSRSGQPHFGPLPRMLSP